MAQGKMICKAVDGIRTLSHLISSGVAQLLDSAASTADCCWQSTIAALGLPDGRAVHVCCLNLSALGSLPYHHAKNAR